MKGITEAEFAQAVDSRSDKPIYSIMRSSRIGIAGLGGLGSNIAVALTRAGIGKLILIDFDKVDITNLNRQQYKMSQLGMDKTEACQENLRDISPYTEIETHTVKLNEEILTEADIICEAFDKADQKAMLVNTVLETFPEKYLISGSGMAGFGSANSIQTRKVFGRFYLCGDEKSDVNDGIGLVASRVMVCAAHEAHMVLRILSGDTSI